MARDESIRGSGRRGFLTGAIATTATGLMPLKAAHGADEHVGHDVKAYKTLGRTGLRISDISFGASRLRTGEEDVVRYAFDRGVNYFDTAESYTGGESEEVIGNALRGKRDKVYQCRRASAHPRRRRLSAWRCRRPISCVPMRCRSSRFNLEFIRVPGRCSRR